MAFCINVGELRKGLLVVALASLSMFGVLITLYVCFALMLPRVISMEYAIVTSASIGVLLCFISLDVVHVFLDSFILLAGGLLHRLRGFETCG